MTLGQHLQNKRKAIKLPYGKKVSLKNMATEIGCSSSNLWAIETDRVLPTLTTAVKIAVGYGTTLEQMAKFAGEQS